MSSVLIILDWEFMSLSHNDKVIVKLYKYNAYINTYSCFKRLLANVTVVGPLIRVNFKMLFSM